MLKKLSEELLHLSASIKALQVCQPRVARVQVKCYNISYI
jgi:hypothetical protein